MNNYPRSLPIKHPTHRPHQKQTVGLLNQHHRIQGHGQREGHVCQGENSPVEGQGQAQMKGHGLTGVRHGVGHGRGGQGQGQGIKVGQNLGQKTREHRQDVGQVKKNMNEVDQNLEQTGKTGQNPELNPKKHINL